MIDQLTPGFYWKIHVSSKLYTIIEIYDTYEGRFSRHIGEIGTLDASEEPTDDTRYFFRKIEPPKLVDIYNYHLNGRGAYKTRYEELQKKTFDELHHIAKQLGLEYWGNHKGNLRAKILKAEGFKRPSSLANRRN